MWIWCGFGKIKTEVQWCSLVNPMLQMGLNAKLENVGIKSYWYEHRLFIDGKPIFRYKSRCEYRFKIKRFLGVLSVSLYNVDQ
jgi:hypothetical protein